MFWSYLEIEGYCDWDDSVARRPTFCPGKISVRCLYDRRQGGPCDKFSCCKSDRVLFEKEIELFDGRYLRFIIRGEPR